MKHLPALALVALLLLGRHWYDDWQDAELQASFDMTSELIRQDMQGYCDGRYYG